MRIIYFPNEKIGINLDNVTSYKIIEELGKVLFYFVDGSNRSISIDSEESVLSAIEKVATE